MLSGDERMDKNKLKEALSHFFNYVPYGKIMFDEKISDEKIEAFIHENNDLIIGTALSEVTDEEKKFLYDRYYSKKTFVSLSIRMHVHINGLQRWRDKILDELSLLLEFKLSDKDVYSRNKVEIMVYVMERIICFYQHYDFEAEDFLNVLKNRLRSYSKCLFIINEALYSDSRKVEYRIIKVKVLNPRLTIEELSEITGYSRTTIYNYFHVFERELKIKTSK